MKTLLLLASILLLIGGSAIAAEGPRAKEQTASAESNATTSSWISALDFGIPSQCSSTTREASAPKRINVAFTKRGMVLKSSYTGSCAAPGVGVLRSAQNTDQQPRHFVKVATGGC